MAISSMDMLGRELRLEHETSEYVRHHRAWFVALGAALILLGVIALGSSLATTYVSMIFLAYILLLGALIRIVACFSAREWTGSLLLALSGVLYLVAAILTFRHPVTAALALTLLFSALFMGVGLFRMIGAVWYHYPQWGWIALSGAISVLLGLLLWNSWPASGLWFIGLYVAIDLIVEGAAWLALSLSSEVIEAPARSAAV
jgi:uncharacterized membrane protein HdeD (DUF308 family)